MVFLTIVLDAIELMVVVIDGLEQDHGGPGGVSYRFEGALHILLLLGAQHVVPDYAGTRQLQAPLEEKSEHPSLILMLCL